jgi:ankyrin repeat protein
MLLHLGADVNAEGSHRYIPMHYAARNNHVDCFRKLLSFEGGKKMRNEANDCEPLVVTAAKYDSEEAAAWLLESAESTDVKDNDGLTPLHHATISDSGNAALLLMMKGADVNSKDKIF